jgi:ribosomal protein L3 glutamine methyltransferase
MEKTLAQCQTVGELIRWGEEQLKGADLFYGHGTDSAWDESVVLVLTCLDIDVFSDREVLGKEVLNSDKLEVESLIQRRITQRIPAPYLVQEAWFCGLSFYVDERVIIPRSPIGELIESKFTPWLDGRSEISVLDLCCGSGCLGIATALAFPGSQVDLADISNDALEVAEINIRRHKLGDSVRCINSNLFEGLDSRHYDLIISNPPYVDAQDLNTMPMEFAHEPILALTGGDDGLDIAARILAEAKNYLSKGGVLVMEVGNSATALQTRYPSMPFIWAEFERGGHGVFILEADDL